MDKKRNKKTLKSANLEKQHFGDDVNHYRELFDLSSAPMLICGEEGLLDLNSATLSLFGVSSADEFYNLHLSTLAPSTQPNGVTSKKLFDDLICEATEQGIASIECICKKFSTEDVFPVDVLVSRLTLHDQLIYQVILMDLSHVPDWQNSLQIKKETADVASYSFETSIITATKDGTLTYINKEACQLTGWSLLDAIGMPVVDVLKLVNANGESFNNYFCEEGSAFRLSRDFPHGTELVSKNGLRILVSGSSDIQCLADNTALGCVITLVERAGHRVVDDDLQWHATHDPLTRLPNRALLADRFKQALISANRHNTLLAVCMMDLDEFKPVNDEYGHAFGDLLLIEVAGRLRQHLRQDDTVARLGGDEFVLLMGNVHNKPELFQTIQRIRTAIAEPYDIEGNQFIISCSIGVALYPEDDVNTDTLLRHADQAMFVAKQAGRNRVHWFDVAQDQEASSSQKLISRIEQALVNKELVLYYQPKVNMRTGKTVGMEALIRWQHPDKGLVPPLDFLPYIEQHELIVLVGEWVLQTALTQLGEWQRQGYDWTVSVNIAAKHFQVSNFTAIIKNVLHQSPNIKPEYLEIEILESVALGNIQHVQSVIENCQSLGVRFALDDFGTGYSSLSYLKRLPADVIKIDQSFVRDILDDKDDLALVQAISSLAVTFDREVVAEGVETVEQGALLIRLGCDVAQGYGIARPMPASDVPVWADQFIPDVKWQVWSKTEWDLKTFPLLVAQYDIQEWLGNVIKRIEEGTLPRDRAHLVDESKCRFGNWYHSDGRQRFGDLDVFIEIDPIHRDLHRVGDEAVQLYIDGEIELAKKKCSSLYTLRDEMFSMLDELQKKAFIR